jgi:2-polyprenyl-6-methoxyphenol hydroxylase-like FAD-dependent oxidoreductase
MGHNRKAVPQGHHAHALLGRGREVMEGFFPGLTQDLINKGAKSGDTQAQVRWYGRGLPLAQAESGMMGLAVSRPLLEGYIRSRVMALPGVSLIENCDVLGLVSTSDKSRVTGVRLVRRNLGSLEESLNADLVLDASGRGSQAPKWLGALSYEAPQIEQVRVGLGYASVHCVRRPEDQDYNAVVVAASPHNPRGAAMIAQEGGRWIVSVGGFMGDHAPTDYAGFLAYTKTLAAPEIAEVVGRGEVIGEIVPFQYPASVRRHYQKLKRFPQGLLVFGDAICSFNPVYGQGMTSAALQALALKTELDKGKAQLAQRFFRAASRVVDIPWSMAVGNDLNHPKVEGQRTPKIRFINWYMSKLFVAAHQDAVVAKAFLKVTNLIAPPPSLMAPPVAWRVLLGNLWPKVKPTAQPMIASKT